MINSNQLRIYINILATRYYRRLLLLGSHLIGKTRHMQAWPEQTQLLLLNLNLALSEGLRTTPVRQHPIHTLRVLDAVLRGDAPVLVDNIELLFEPGLNLDPLRALKRSSRIRTLVVAWPGERVQGAVTFAEAGRLDFRRYPAANLADIMLLDLATLPE